MMRTACILLLIVLKAYHEDAATSSMTIKEIIRSYGYPAEEYRQIKTDDDYLLTVHRIPYGVNNTKRGNRPAVFLMHGILTSAIDWVNMGPGFSIAYDLVEAGYDVWMGNARGNKFSRKHRRLHPILNHKKFWAFSWHEIGYYDLPAMIDFVLSMTDQKALFYIGHSQGTTSFFVMTSMKPKYNRLIKLMVALAPVVYMNHASNPFIQMLRRFDDPLKWDMSIFGSYEFLPGEELFNKIGKRVCRGMVPVRAMCANPLFMICGWDSQQLNASTIYMIIANAPAGAASRQFVHYSQVSKSKTFRQYDFGLLTNLVKYHSSDPPKYELAKVKAPVSLVFADNDWLSSPLDVYRLKAVLPNIVDMHRVPFMFFNHLDYLFAINVKNQVNDHVLHTLNRFK